MMPSAQKQKPLFKGQRGRPLIAPSILSADFARLEQECRDVLDHGADLLHLDVMDGHFVPNLSMGPALCGALRNHFPGTFLDVHMMVTHPGSFISPFADAGADNFTVHVECDEDPLELADAIHASGMTAGLAIKPDTDFSRMEPLIDHFELLLVMSVYPGFSGQSFIPEVLETTRLICDRARDDQHIQMDGGIGPGTASACKAAGCDVLVAASAIFKGQDYGQAIDALRDV